MIKGTDEQPDEETTVGEVWEGPEHGSFCPIELGCFTFPVHGCVQQPGCSQP